MSFRFSSHYRQSLKVPLEDIQENENQKRVVEAISDDTLRRRCRQSLNIKEGANKIFSLSGNIYQKLDAAKAILVSERRVEHITSKMNINDESSLFKCQMTISEIRVPLLWRSLTGTLLANGRYVLFAVVLTDKDVRETQLVCDINSYVTDVTFHDVIQIDDISLDGYCLIELYGYALEMSSSHLRKKRLLRTTSFDQNNNTLNRNLKKRSVFERLGSAKIRCIDSVSNNDLSLNIFNVDRNILCDLPLFETMRCHVNMVPMSKLHCVLKGEAEVKMLSRDKELSVDDKWIRYYCELRDRMLNCWLLEADVTNSIGTKSLLDRLDVPTADLLIPITKHSRIKQTTSDENEDVLRLFTYFDDELTDYQECLIKPTPWFELIAKYIKDQIEWKVLFEHMSKVPLPTSFVRQGSVYRPGSMDI